MLVVIAVYAKAVAELKDKLVEELGDRIESIVLYGSVAKKKAREDSDIDVLIVVRDEGDKGLYDRISRIRTRIDLDHNTLTTLVYMGSGELERYAKLGSPFIRSVAQEGVVLYDRGVFKRVRGSVVAEG